MEVGALAVCETVVFCQTCRAPYCSEELARVVPYRCRFGYNVIEYVGRALFLRGCSEQQVQQELSAHNISASLNQVGYLGRKFIAYLALVHKESGNAIREHLARQGGYILHVDATCEGDSPFVMSGLDEISNTVLHNVKIPSENTQDIVPFLQEIVAANGTPLAVISDMSGAIAAAVSEVLPGVAHYICHFHFLRDIGKDLLEASYDTIRRTLRSLKTRAQLRALAKTCRVKIEQSSELTDALTQYATEHTNGLPSQTLPGCVLAYTLVLWVLCAPKTATGKGFPFDRPHLLLYERLLSVHNLFLQKTTLHTKSPALERLKSISREIVHNHALERAASSLHEKIAVFDRLRHAMRIALPGSKTSLNDDGKSASFKTIKKALSEFRADLELNEKAKTSRAYEKMFKQIDASWKKLFADPLTVTTQQGSKIIYPQRTNNILERFFRSLKRTFRRKTGNHSLTRILRAMLADTPLVQNILNPEWMRIVLKGKSSLAERFADLDPHSVRQYLHQLKDLSHQRVPNKLKRLLRISDLADKLAVNPNSRLAA